MTLTQIQKLKNTLQPGIRQAVRKTLLKQRSSTPAQKVLEDKLIDVAYKHADSALQSARRDAGQGTRQTEFPSKQVLVKYKNEHTVDKYVTDGRQKLFDAREQALQPKKGRNIVDNPAMLFQLAQSPELKELESSLKHSRYMQPETRKTLKRLSYMRWSIKQTKTKIEDFIERNTKYDLRSVSIYQVISGDKKIRELYVELVKKYNIRNAIVDLRTMIVDMLPIEDVQDEKSSEEINYIPLVFGQGRQYPQSFVQTYSKDPQKLRTFVEQVIRGKLDVRSTMGDYWYMSKRQLFDPTAYDTIRNVLNKNQIVDPKQQQRVISIVINRLRKDK